MKVKKKIRNKSNVERRSRKNGRKREDIYHETKGISVRLAGLDT